MPERVDAARKEFERWRGRERRILEAMSQVEEETRRLSDELVRVDHQIAYYDSLTRDMKRELGRPGLSSLLSSLRKT